MIDVAASLSDERDEKQLCLFFVGKLVARYQLVSVYFL